MVTVLLLLAWSVLTTPQAAPRTERLLVSLSAENRMVFIDPSTGRVEAGAQGMTGPHEITVSRDGLFAYIANAGGGPGTPGRAVSAIDLRTREVRHLSTESHDSPHDVRVSRDGRTLWVAAAPSRAILEMDVPSGRISRTLSVANDGGWFVIATPDDAKLYVPLLEGKGLVSVDRRNGRSVKIASGGAFSGAELTPDGRHLWAIEHEASRIVIISTQNDAIAGTVRLPSASFGRIQITPDGQRALVVQDRALHDIDVRERRITRTLDMPLAGKVLAISRSGEIAAVSNPADGQVTFMDLAVMRVIRSVPVGKGPDGVAWIPANPD